MNPENNIRVVGGGILYPLPAACNPSLFTFVRAVLEEDSGGCFGADPSTSTPFHPVREPLSTHRMQKEPRGIYKHELRGWGTPKVLFLCDS